MNMIGLNNGISSLEGKYIFALMKDMTERAASSGKKPADLGIGDVTLPLPRSVAAAVSEAALGLAGKQGFYGYGPYGGYDFLREAVAALYGGAVLADEVYITCGAKEALALLAILPGEAGVCLPDPCYPPYYEVNAVFRRRIGYHTGTAEPGDARIIYLCSPSNPTGKALSRLELSDWVSEAKSSGSLIVYDAAYSAFITDGSPRSIYEIDGAQDCAIEVGSFSKYAGFTGIRCGWLVIPDRCGLRDGWERLAACMTNGVSYLSQCAALAALSPEGRRECEANIKYYLENGRIVASALEKCGIVCCGQMNSPYVWAECPKKASGFDIAKMLLFDYGVAVTPGEGFGAGGRGHFRVSCFCSREDAIRASGCFGAAFRR